MTPFFQLKWILWYAYVAKYTLRWKLEKNTINPVNPMFMVLFIVFFEPEIPPCVAASFLQAKLYISYNDQKNILT